MINKQFISNLIPIDAEQMLLGAMMSRAQDFYPYVMDLGSEQFGHPTHQTIWGAIQNIIAQHGAANVSERAVLEKLRRDGVLEKIKNLPEYVNKIYLKGIDVTFADIPSLAETIRDYYKRRRLLEAASEIIDEITNGRGQNAAAMLAKAHEQLLAIETRSTVLGPKDVLGRLMERVDDERNYGLVFNWGLAELNRRVSTAPGELMIVVGEEKSGKSALMYTAALATMLPNWRDVRRGLMENKHVQPKYGRHVLIISTEMQNDDIMARLTAILANIPLIRFRRNRRFFAPDEYERFKTAAQIIAEMPLVFVEKRNNGGTSVNTIEEVEKSVRLVVAQHPDTALVVLDHIGDLTFERNHYRSMAEKMRDIVLRVKALALDASAEARKHGGRGLVILTAQHTNREGIASGRPGKENVAWTSQITRTADGVIALFQDDENIRAANERVSEQYIQAIARKEVQADSNFWVRWKIRPIVMRSNPDGWEIEVARSLVTLEMRDVAKGDFMRKEIPM